MFQFRKKQLEELSHQRLVPRQAEAFFSVVLVLLCAFMAVIMYGSGSIIGGSLFSIVVFIGVYAVYDVIRARRYPDLEDDTTSALEP